MATSWAQEEIPGNAAPDRVAQKATAGQREKPPIEPDESLRCTRIWQYQARAEWYYTQPACEYTVAVLILSNFLMNILEATIDPGKTKYAEVFSGLELFYNICFTAELVLNMYAFWCERFWKDGWNVFDFVVVSIGLLTTFNVDLGPLGLLRMMRAFRVFRVFKRVESLKQIVAALCSAIPGVVNAFVILLLVMCIYAIIGVEVFSTQVLGGTTTVNSLGVAEVEPHSTPRGQDYGYEYFGNFPKAMYTIFQVLTGDSWCESVARATLNTGSVLSSLGVAFYYVSFVLLCAVILINVVVAVLLEKMCVDAAKDDMPVEAAPESGQASDSKTSSLARADTTAAPDSDEEQEDPEDVETPETKTLAKEVARLKEEMSDLRDKLASVATLLHARHTAQPLS